jgi:hypothetical protein
MNKIFYYFQQLPIRIKRLWRHVIYPFYRPITNEFPPKGVLEWSIDVGFYIMDIVAMPEVYEIIFSLLKIKTRPLTNQEKALAKSIFGNSIQYDLVKVDTGAKFGTKKIALAYVSFNTINYLRNIDKAIFIHELMHIWQFQQFGSIYIARAIKAQRSKEGYDYGGIANLYQVMLKGGSLLDFNFEQQADIIEDYYRIKENPTAAAPMNLSVYAYFAKEVYR